MTWRGGEGRGAGVERVFREGAEDPLFNFTRSFQMREKAESGVLCHPATQGPLKSSLSGFSSEVSSQETKKEEKNEWAKNLMVVLYEGLAVGGWPL